MSSGIVAQLVRALPCHGRGREFESRRFRHFCFHKNIKKERLVLRIESRRAKLEPSVRFRHFCFHKNIKKGPLKGPFFKNYIPGILNALGSVA